VNADRPAEFGIAGELPPKITPGEYDLVYVRHETARMFKGRAHKLTMLFRIVTMGEFFEAELPRYYNVQNVARKRKKNGNFKVGLKCDFIREYYTLFPGRITRRDRIPMSPFKGSIITGRVITVKEARGRPIPTELQYSRIDQLLGVKT